MIRKIAYAAGGIDIPSLPEEIQVALIGGKSIGGPSIGGPSIGGSSGGGSSGGGLLGGPEGGVDVPPNNPANALAC